MRIIVHFELHAHFDAATVWKRRIVIKILKMTPLAQWAAKNMD
jgi:hypothetical protein